MSEIFLKKITYKDLRKKSYEAFDDRYGIAAFITDSVRKTFLEYPGYQDDSDTVAFFLLDGDIVIGRVMKFATKLKIGEDIVWANSGCAMEVCEPYRKSGAGVMLITGDNGKKYGINFSALFTEMRITLLKKQKSIVYEFPQYTKLVGTRVIFESFRLKGILLKAFSWTADGLLRLLEVPNKIRTKRLLKCYTVKKETVIPEWAGEMATNDGHKYMEYHDAKWLQWNLDNNLNGYPEDIQSFYAVYDKDGAPQGFFMTKERLEKEAGRYRNLVRGTIVEWASADERKLSEADLNLFAISTFSHRVSHITTLTVNPATDKKLKKMGFIVHNILHMSFKDKTGLYTDACDQSLWRIRFGCCNTIIY